MAISAKQVRETRSRLSDIHAELKEQDKVVAGLREEIQNASDTKVADDPKVKQFLTEARQLELDHSKARVEMESLRVHLALDEHGSDALNDSFEVAEELRTKHDEAVKQMLQGSGEQGPGLGLLDKELRDEFVSEGKGGVRQFRLNPVPVPESIDEFKKMHAVGARHGIGRLHSMYRGDSGDGADLVQTDLAMNPIERTKFYGNLKGMVQNFTYMGSGKIHVPIGDQTSTLATSSGTGGSMIDEAYGNFAAAKKDYNLERKVQFGDYELLVWTAWTDRALRFTEFKTPARFLRLLETAIKREENRLMVESTTDGSLLTRTNVPGVRSMVPSVPLADNNDVTMAEINKLFFTLDPSYVWGTEDEVMRVEDFDTNVVNDPMTNTLGWMMHYSVVQKLVERASTQADNYFKPWFLQWGRETGFRLMLYGLPVYVNNAMGELQGTAGSIAQASRKPVIAFGRWGYLARRNCDYYLREFTGDSGVKMDWIKLGNAAIALSAFDFNALSVGPTAGKTEAIAALAHK